MNKWISNILAVIVIVCMFMFMQYKFFPKIETETITVTDTLWKDTTIVKYVPKPYPIYIDTSRTDTVYVPTDDSLLKVLYLSLHQKYFSTYTYNDTIKNDSLAFMSLESKITQNKPIFYKETYFDRTPSIISNTTNISSQNEFYIGLSAGYNKLGPNLLFKSKKDYIFGIEYNVLNSSIEGKVGINVNKLKPW